MKKILFVLIPFSVFSQISYNLELMVKDTSIINLSKKNIYPIPAIEIAAKSQYQEKNTINYPIRIAIDPGHIASNKKEAILEERFVNSSYGFFYESKLNEMTALILKRKLEERGFLVQLSRQPGKTAFGYTYSYWYRKLAKKELSEQFKNGTISKEKFNELYHANKKDLFNKYFKNKEFIQRSININNFKPDIVVIIHYNATEFENLPKKYAPIVDYNYTVAFVPGAFTNNELSTESQLPDFIRIATSDIIKKSILLSDCIVSEFENKLGVPRLKPTDLPELWYLKKYSIYTQVPGVFSRNLYLTRTVNAPVCYAECTLQNNVTEIQKLTKKDIKVSGKTTSSRVLDFADAFYSGILKYFQKTGVLQ